MIDTLFAARDWLTSNALIVSSLSVLSLALLLASIFVAPWLIARLPADYFSVPRPPRSSRTVRSLLLAMLRNTVGICLLLAGMIMLIAPGPGLLVILVALALCEFPGRHALVCWLVSHPRVFESLNWIRRQRHRAAFIAPELH